MEISARELKPSLLLWLDSLVTTGIEACWPFMDFSHSTELTACWEIVPIPSKKTERKHPAWTNDLDAC